MADAFQSACFLQVAPMSQATASAWACWSGLLARGGAGQQFAEVVQRLRLAEPVAHLAV